MALPKVSIIMGSASDYPTMQKHANDSGCPPSRRRRVVDMLGKGQRLVRNPHDARAAQIDMPGAAWVLEEPVDIVSEASCIVARSGSEEATFPIAENLHRDHILDRSLVDVLDVNIYGKTRPKHRRKMGHSVVMAATPDDALERAEGFRVALKSSGHPARGPK